MPTNTHVFLEGDPCPICTPLSPEALVMSIRDSLTANGGFDGLLFVRIPLDNDRPDALVDPRRIVALVPVDEDE